MQIAHGATLTEPPDHSTLGERNFLSPSVKEHRRNVELSKSGSNIANHAWTNNHKIDFNSKHRETLESWHNAEHLPEQYRFLLSKEL